MAVQQLMVAQRITAAPPPGGFPQIASVTSTFASGNQINHNVSMPASVSAGDLLVVSFGLSGNPTITTPAGWTSLTQVTDTGFTIRSAVFYKVAAGSEGGTTVNFVTSQPVGINALTIRVTGAAAASMIEQATAQIVNTYTAVPADLTPAWGALETLWIVIGSNRRANPVGSYPFPDNQQDVTAISTPPGGICICSIEDEIATIDPPNLVYTNTSGHTGEYGVVFTIGIKPA